MAPSSDDRARLRLQRAGMVETLRALADELARIGDDDLDDVLAGLRGPLDGLIDATARLLGGR